MIIPWKDVRKDQSNISIGIFDYTVLKYAKEAVLKACFEHSIFFKVNEEDV